MKKVLFIPSCLRSEAIIYYRCIQPATFLNANKYANVKVLTKFPNNYGQIDLSAFDWADIIITQRFYADNPFLKFLKMGYDLFKGFKIYETDDLVWDIPYKLVREDYNKTKDFTEKLINDADRIICTTDYLKGQFIKKFDKKDIRVIPNSIDRAMWEWDRQPHDKVRIIYAAGGTHWKELQFIKKVLKIVRKNNEVETMLLSPYTNEKEDDVWDHVYPYVPFKDFPKYLTSLSPDIGLAPIVDKTPFMFSKSNIKFLDFTMAGAVSILEDCETYANVSSAIKVRGKDNWVKAIIELLDKKKREDLWQRANKETWQKFDIHHNVELWKQSIR